MCLNGAFGGNADGLRAVRVALGPLPDQPGLRGGTGGLDAGAHAEIAQDRGDVLPPPAPTTANARLSCSSNAAASRARRSSLQQAGYLRDRSARSPYAQRG